MFKIHRATPEETGIPSSAILRSLDRLEQYHIPMHSIQIMRHDRLVAEGYYAPCAKGQLHRMFSISKSLTSLAICKLEEEGKLSLNDPIICYFREYVPSMVHPWLYSMSIRHMLMMRTCHSKTTYKLDMNQNWVKSFFTTPPDHKPGTLFHYDTSAPHTLCALVEKLTQMPMLEYLKNVLLREIGFSEDSYMLSDPFGTSLGGSGLMATPEDMLRLGYLLMRNGRLDEKELIPAAFLEQALSNQTPTAVTAPVFSEAQGYGYQFWRGEQESSVCYGMGGQLIICLPREDLLMVTTADTQGIGGGNQLIYHCLFEELLPALKEQPIEPSGDSRLLAERLASLSLTPLQRIYPVSGGPYSLDMGKKGSAVTGTYRLLENRKGFTSLSVSLTEEQGVLSYRLNGQLCHLPFGWDHVISCRFPVYDMFCAASGMFLDPNTLYIRVHLLDTSVGSVHFQLVFGEGDVTMFLKKTEESLFTEYDGHFYGAVEW